MNLIHLLYKSETGREAIQTEISVVRKQGQWIVDADDDTVLDLFGWSGCIEIPDDEYVRWLEEKLDEFVNR